MNNENIELPKAKEEIKPASSPLPFKTSTMDFEHSAMPKEEEVKQVINKQQNIETKPLINEQQNIVDKPLIKEQEEKLIVPEDSGKNHKFMEFIKDLRYYIITRSTDEIFKLVYRFFLIALLVVLLKLPFQLASDAGRSILIILNIDITTRVQDVWDAVWTLIYIAFSVLLLYSLLKDRFYKLVNIQKIKAELGKQ